MHELPADRYEYVVVDEFHHAAAPSYRAAARPCASPRLAGSDRHAGADRQPRRPRPASEGTSSAQIRLPDAINRKLLSPFQYFAVADHVDLERAQLAARRIPARRARPDLHRQRPASRSGDREGPLDPARPTPDAGLGFCVSIAHAEYMAAKFYQAGIAAEALSAVTDRAEPSAHGPGPLEAREVNFLFVVDLYNEGIDIPEIDTVLFLRPTESLTVFLQQLGRGLRLFEEKECLTVLDFIGQAHRNFRFDLRYRALLTDPSVPLEGQVEHGFTAPARRLHDLRWNGSRGSTCWRISRQSLRQTRIVSECYRARAGRDSSASPRRLADFLEHTGIEPDDLYRREVGWSRLCIDAGSPRTHSQIPTNQSLRKDCDESPTSPTPDRYAASWSCWIRKRFRVRTRNSTPWMNAGS